MDSHPDESSRTPPSHFGRSASPSFAESSRSRRQSRSRSRSSTPSYASKSAHTHSHTRSRSPLERPLKPTFDRGSGKTAIYVENLSPNVRPCHLEHIFGWYGHVISIHVSSSDEIETGEGGKGRNWAYVQMSSVQEATKSVLYMSGGQIDGVAVQVQCCVWPKDLQPSRDDSREMEVERKRRRRSRYDVDRDERSGKNGSHYEKKDWTGERWMHPDSRKRILSADNNNTSSSSRNNDNSRDGNQPMRKWGAPNHT
ncbi:uncharacterized protein UTRI_03904 [Ustilago trichophora]|uniref:RRM domain-containing protein n=1 Tax=Ustilago trichophora TaxID=86804 RepID=A0A5C3E8B6_9BASI|nr:uncharacterized protein UTRI_03904 [Ustilago trichophora]